MGWTHGADDARGTVPGPVSSDNIIGATFPTRACLSGEDLDWLGGRSVCLALELPTTVTIATRGVETGTSDPGDLVTRRWAVAAWAFLRTKIPDLSPFPPHIVVMSEAPVASGLASSTALILGILQAFIDLRPQAVHVPPLRLAEWAYEFEFAMCRGGGMDQLSVMLGGALLCQGRTRGLPDILDRLEFPSEWSVVVVDSATPKSTQDHIRVMRAQVESGDRRLADYMMMADEASASAWQAIRSRDLGALARAMDQAHVAMRDLQGMSTPLLECLRKLALSAAGFPVKLTGAGGGGALVGVCSAADSDQVVRLLRRAYQGDHPDVGVLSAEPAGFRQPA